MGFLDSILGKTRLPEARQQILNTSTAAVALETSSGCKADGIAGVFID